MPVFVNSKKINHFLCNLEITFSKAKTNRNGETPLMSLRSLSWLEERESSQRRGKTEFGK